MTSKVQAERPVLESADIVGCERCVCCADLFNFIDHMQDMSALV